MGSKTLDLLSLPGGAVIQLVAKSSSWFVITTDNMHSFRDSRVRDPLVSGVIAYRLEGFVITPDVPPQSWFFSRHVVEDQPCYFGDNLTLPMATDPIVGAFRVHNSGTERLI